MTRTSREPTRSDRDDFVCCTVGDERYALRGSDVRLIARAEQMRGGPALDGSVGTLDVADQRVPVFALGPQLGRPDVSANRANSASYIAVTGENGELVGWLVDRIARPAVCDDPIAVRLPPIVGRAATDTFEALLKLGDESMLLVAPHQINPLATRARQQIPNGSFLYRPAIASRPEPLVVIFSTLALPPCEASRYALSGRQIAAVVQPAQTVVVPGSAPHVKGVFWWRNAVVPVVDFCDRGNCDAASLGRRHLIAYCGEQLGGSLVAVPIDSDIALHRPAAVDQLVPDVERPAFAHGLFDVRGETVALVSLDALLTAAC